MHIFLIESLNKHAQIIKENEQISSSKVCVILHCLPHKPGNLWSICFFSVTVKTPNILGFFMCIYSYIIQNKEGKGKKSNFSQIYNMPRSILVSLYVLVYLNLNMKGHCEIEIFKYFVSSLSKRCFEKCIPPASFLWP